MKNKTLLLIAFLVLAIIGLAPVSAQAQTATYSTVTSAAITASQPCFQVASTTNMSASGALTGPGGTPQEWDLYVDGEFDKINTVNTTSNQVCVMRGKSPTRAGAHPTASLVFYGPAGLVPFIINAPLPSSPGNTDQKGSFGSCVSTNYQFLPLINVSDGSIWNCLTSARGGRWVAYGFRQWTSGHPTVNILDAAYTASLADEFVTYTTLTATRILTLPNINGVIGKSMVIIGYGTGGGSITITPVPGQNLGPNSVSTLANGGGGVVTRLITMLNAAGLPVWATW